MSNLPIATYRLQFRNGMTFDRAVEIVPYLKKLGVSHLYASPLFAATKGSTHGYDVIDHNRLDPDLGGEEGFARLSEALRSAGLKLLLDIVPNHMAASLENPWWRSVIEFGRNSPFAGHFDIDWSRRLTLPVLGKSFAEVLEAGELKLATDPENGAPALAYFDNFYPLNPGTFDGLPPDPEGMTKLSNDRSFLSALHARQSWELTFWKDARHDLSYRRFFEVTGLVGVRVEEPDVFNDVHALVLELVRSGKVDGLRVDHVDGLTRPGEYLARLQSVIGRDKLLLVEKILGPGEKLPSAWGDIGTTGYEFIDSLSNLMVDPAGREAMRDVYSRYTMKPLDIAEETRAAKRLMLRRNFEGELMRLARLALANAQGAGLSFQQDMLADALVELILGFEVYRTYGEWSEFSAQDLAVLGTALETALTHGEADAAALKFVATLLHGDRLDPVLRQRFQQLTGPVMAKAVEDTLFYRVNPLIALNEVGSHPTGGGGEEAFHRAMQEKRPVGLLATSTHDTKRGEDARARLYTLAEAPDVWFEAVKRWSRMNAPLRKHLDGRKVPEYDVEWLIYQALAGIWPVVTPDEEDIAGLLARFLPYLEKSQREAKLRTDWTEENTTYEAAVASFVQRMLSPQNSAFLEDFSATLQPFIAAGVINSLSQTLAKLTAPGIPDIYQGAEGLDFSLVDPDNRRPVDFAGLSSWLEQPSTPSASIADERRKQEIIAQTLRARAQHPLLFLKGAYLPISIHGPLASYHTAYLREHGDEVALVVLTRLPLTRAVLSSVTETALEIPPRHLGKHFRSIFCDETFVARKTLCLDDILRHSSIALAFAK